MGTLYIVGTPIGNLGDFSPRAIEILKTVDFIAAEDTRVTLKLFNHFEIRNTLISYHEHNAAARGPELLERLLNGENGAIVTDAGMPCISDPGEGLVALCHENGVEIATVPGPTAAMTALAASGLPTGKFLFEGFLPIKKGERDTALQVVSRLPHTLIFYEYPQIRADFEAGIRNRDYLKKVPKQKRIDLFQQKPGDVVYFDDEEFKYYFPHE